MTTMTEAEARRWEYQLVAIAGGCLVFATLAMTVFPAALAGAPPALAVAWILPAMVVLFLAASVLVLAAAWLHHRWFFSPRQRLRRDLGGPEGWVDSLDLRESCGPRAIVAEGERFWRRRDLEVQQAGWVVGEPISGRWPVRSQLIRSPYPRSAVVVGPQGSGKSQYVIPLVLDLPAAAVVTSTKSELYLAAGPKRSQLGEVYVFDPQNMTGGAHNFPFDPVIGCANAQLADLTAEAMIRGASISKRMTEEFWADAGREILRCYLLAADLSGGSSYDVQSWTHNPDDEQPLTILRQYQHKVPHGWLSLLEVRLHTNVRQRDGYFGTVSSCMDYLGHPGGAQACTQARRGAEFTMDGFLAERCTLFIIGDKNERGMASMMTALTEQLAYRARQVRGGLHEPLAMILDEVANLTPVDLPKWTTEFRGQGIMTVAVIQSRAQLDKTWGPDNGQIIWDNLVTKVILPDLGDEDFLEGLSRLAGERKFRRTSDTTRGGGQGSIGLERVIPLHVIRSLPPFHAFMIGIPRHPAVVAWEPGYRRLERERTGEPWRPAWPRWWRRPLHAASIAFGRAGRR